MNFNKKGLSDVVSTVLIIMVVIIAVVAIYTLFVQPFLTEGGEKVNTATLCIENTLKPVTCKITGANANVGLQTTSTDGVTIDRSQDVSNQLVKYYASGAAQSQDIVIANVPLNGASATTTATGAVGLTQVEVTATFMAGGSAYKCTSAKIACS